MESSPLTGYETQYKLLRRFEAVIESIFALNTTVQQLGIVRFKPIFSHYISCIEAFKSAFPEEYNQLALEDIKLDVDGKKLFTANRLSTILNQAQAVVGLLKGLLPPPLIENPGGTTILVSSQAAAQSSAKSTSSVHFTLVLEGLAQAVQESDLDQRTKDQLAREIENVKLLPSPDRTRIKHLAEKLGAKLQNIGENVLVGLIDRLLRFQIGL